MLRKYLVNPFGYRKTVSCGSFTKLIKMKSESITSGSIRVILVIVIIIIGEIYCILFSLPHRLDRKPRKDFL